MGEIYWQVFDFTTNALGMPVGEPVLSKADSQSFVLGTLPDPTFGGLILDHDRVEIEELLFNLTRSPGLHVTREERGWYCRLCVALPGSLLGATVSG